ncbi:MAG: HAD family hydrolase [Lachnospiraceae bacterium]|nr:HAD family hydrolase [Lachnospiraceae bacterium]
MYRTILFDLDGTLTDSSEGITKSIRYAFEHFGIEVTSLEELRVYIGPPLRTEFMKRLGVDEERSAQLYAKFRERYTVTGWKENRPYPGIPETLARLKEAGYRLAVATSKPESTARRVLEYFDLTQYFDVICGAGADGKDGEKWQIVSRALKEMDAEGTKKAQAVMVGDRDLDILGGRKNGIDAIGLNIGFGSRRELEEAGAVYVAESAEELADYLLSGA